ncbi:hypothetical protein MTR_2g038305 [Medicago truncatula]|uniref:Uncharacterized protein n=1 Tax=Medicago truncatula TaxID=3880 RepID=A0A072VH42_MEDTR|nr:hypothetical protein MTR_2g038305 [Medicago truncatula]
MTNSTTDWSPKSLAKSRCDLEAHQTESSTFLSFNPYFFLLNRLERQSACTYTDLVVARALKIIALDTIFLIRNQKDILLVFPQYMSATSRIEMHIMKIDSSS